MGVTIADVAREAGVSITTVSRFINGRYDAMSTETRERLQAVIERLGYVPDGAAQSLRTGRSLLIGVVLANIAHPYWALVLAGIEEECRRLGYGVLISSAGNRSDLEDRYLHVLLKKRVDGILLNPTAISAERAARWAALPCPVVALDRTVRGLDHLDLVAMDNVAGAKLAVQHLLSLGHRRIGFISWAVNGLSNREERLRGYREALQEAGIEPDPRWVIFARERWGDAARRILGLFAGPAAPTAIFSPSGLLNLEVLTGLRLLGLRIPDDVSVVGYDESPWDALLDPPLTTVATPAKRLGVLAVRQLHWRIVNGSAAPRREVRLKVKLVVRGSTQEVRADGNGA